MFKPQDLVIVVRRCCRLMAAALSSVAWLGMLAAIGLPAGLGSARAAANVTPVLFPYVVNFTNGGAAEIVRVNNTTGPTNAFGAPATSATCTATVVSDTGTTGTITFVSNLAAGTSTDVSMSAIATAVGLAAGTTGYLIASCNSPYVYPTLQLVNSDGTVFNLSAIPMQSAADINPVLAPLVENFGAGYTQVVRVNNATGSTNPFGWPATSVTCTATVVGDNGATGTTPIVTGLAAGMSATVNVSTIIANSGIGTGGGTDPAYLIASCNSPYVYSTVQFINSSDGALVNLSSIPMQSAAPNVPPRLFPYVGNFGSTYTELVRVNNTTGPTNPFGAPATSATCTATVAGDGGSTGTTPIVSNLAAGTSATVLASNIITASGVDLGPTNRGYLIGSCDTPYVYLTLMLVSPDGTTVNLSNLPMEQPPSNVTRRVFPFVGEISGYTQLIRVNNATGPTNPYGVPAASVTCTATIVGDNGATGTSPIYSSLAAGTSTTVTVSAIVANSGVDLGGTNRGYLLASCNSPFAYVTELSTNPDGTVTNLSSIPLPACSSTADAHDFNGDCTSDILWRDNSGDIAMWLMNAGQFSSGAAVSQVTSVWSLVGQRDFNGDGNADLLWLDQAGDLGLWEMNGVAISAQIGLGNVGASWKVAGTGDFNGDGTGDVLWRDGSSDLAIWLMSNGQLSSGVSLGQVGSAWSVAGTGDFNGDGTTDILWYNTQTGNVAIWLMGNGQLALGVGLGNVGTQWSVVGTGDFNGDGTSDILWRDSSGDLAIWLISNGRFSSGATIGQVSTQWSVAETGDFNGDGKSDILWLCTTAGGACSVGDLAVWLMNGTALGSGIGLGNVGTSWTVQGKNAD